MQKNVTVILNTLNEHGYEGYVVGGAVRDYVMGKTPHDWDITTNAKPEEVKAMFSKTVDTGIKHGTVTAILDGEGYEITTYRTDGNYTDGRHPDSVAYEDHIEKDLSRRDLTINAMAMDVHGKIVDPFGGLNDIRNGIIRCVGLPDDRFTEDALRMMRAVRFEAQLGFTLDDTVKASIRKNADKLAYVSNERIRDELTKMLMSKEPKRGFLDAYETGITALVLPEFDRMMQCEQNTPYHYANVGIHSLDTVESIRPDAILRWTMLLHDVGKPDTKTHNAQGYDAFYDHPLRSRQIADDIMIRLRFSNKDRREIGNLIEDHDIILTRNSKIRAYTAMRGSDYIDELEAVKFADAKAHSPQCVDTIQRTHQAFIDKARGCIADGTAIRQCDLRITGYELMEYGLKGKTIGEFQKKAYIDCLGNPSLNNNASLRMLAFKMMMRYEGISDIRDIPEEYRLHCAPAAIISNHDNLKYMLEKEHPADIANEIMRQYPEEKAAELSRQLQAEFPGNVLSEVLDEKLQDERRFLTT